MTSRLFLLVLLLFTGFSGEAQYRDLLHKTHAQRYIPLENAFYHNNLLSQDSVIFFRELAKLQEVAEQAGDEELVLETILLRCEYYMHGRQQNHNLFRAGMLNLRDQADQKNILHLQIRTRQKLGYYYFMVEHKYGPGFDNYLNSYQLLKDLPVAELPGKQELIANIGSAYYQFGDNVNARKFLMEAFKTPPSYKKRLPINLTNTLGLIFREEKKFDSAEV